MESIYQLFKNLGLEAISCTPKPLADGLLHKTWKATTKDTPYAVKKLNPSLAQDKAFIQRLLKGEETAEALKNEGIPAVPALKIKNSYTHRVANETFLIFPLIKGAPLTEETLKPSHLKSLGHTFAKIHNTSLNIDNPPEAPPFYVLLPSKNSINWKEITSLSKNKPYKQLLADCLPYLLKLSQNYEEALPVLSQSLTLSHRDCHQKNILWDADNNLHIIDWETTGLINPTQEILGIALEWSCPLSKNINQDTFHTILKAYLETGGILKSPLKTAYYGFMGYSVLSWFAYNVYRADLSKNTEEQALAQKIVTELLTFLNLLEANEPIFFKLFSSYEE